MGQDKNLDTAFGEGAKKSGEKLAPPVDILAESLDVMQRSAASGKRSPLVEDMNKRAETLSNLQRHL